MQKTVDSSTTLIVDAARRRGVAVESLQANPNLVILTHQTHREFMYFSSSDHLGRVTFKIFLVKPAAHELLRRGNFPVPAELFTDSIDEITTFLAKHKKIVIKPIDSVWGQGVTPGIAAAADIAPAVELARSFNADRKEPRVVCQQHVDGTEYRVLVVDCQHVFAVRRIPAHVVGDGETSLQALVAKWNEQVASERRIEITDAVHSLLREQQRELTDVPAAGETVYLKRVANAHAGGIVHDATDELGESVRQTSVAIAKYFNVPLVGIDCISSDISHTLGVVIELNSTPDITLHHAPTVGEPRNVADKIIDMLFPETAT